MIDCINCSKAQNRLHRFFQGGQSIIIPIVPKRTTDYIDYYFKNHNRLYRYRSYRDIVFRD
jgi:hypothetical protein